MDSIQEQEYFMHLIYDCVHNGIGLHNLEYAIENLKLQNKDVPKILNSRLKNERYYESFDYPLAKVVSENWNEISYHNKKEFFDTKLKAINLLLSHGANIHEKDNVSYYYMLYTDRVFLSYNMIILQFMLLLLLLLAWKYSSSLSIK